VHLTIIKNGQYIDHREMGIECLSFEKDSVTTQNIYEQLEGRHGFIPLGTTFGGRSLRASFFVKNVDHLSYQKLKNEIFRLFAVESEITIIDSRQPETQWKVKVANTFGIENINFRAGQFTVEFLSSSPFSESVESTLNMVIAQMSGSKTQKYKHATSSFEIFNDGDAAIDPRSYPFLIQFKGASTNLQIKNLTIGDTWSYTGTSTASDTIKLDGIRSTKNNLSIFRDTNRKLITLAPGWNEFQIVGASGSYEISFDFRFYTL
jgi:phage-related protein